MVKNQLELKLAADFYEQTNAAYNPEYRDKRLELQTDLRTWAEKSGDRFTVPEGQQQGVRILLFSSSYLIFCSLPKIISPICADFFRIAC